MYLISTDYQVRKSAQLHTSKLPKIAPSTKQKKTKKTRGARVKGKKKGPLHPYDKWVAMRSEIAEAAVGRKALIKAIADFIKAVLPDTTLAQKATTPGSESAEEGTQTARKLTTSALRFEPLRSTSAGDVYETETSPVSTRFAGPTTLAYDDDDDNRDTGAVSEDETHKFARRSFGAIASPYVSPYVHKSGVLDAEYGLRKVGDRFL
jgi:hypothetical protein